MMRKLRSVDSCAEPRMNARSRRAVRRGQVLDLGVCAASSAGRPAKVCARWHPSSDSASDATMLLLCAPLRTWLR